MRLIFHGFIANYIDIPRDLFPVQDAIAANSYLCKEKVIEHGDVSAGFDASDHIISSELYIGGQVNIAKTDFKSDVTNGF